MSTLLPQFGNVPNYPSTLKNGHVAYLFKQQPKSCSAKPEKVQQILRDSHSFDIGLLVLNKINLDFIKLNKSARPNRPNDLAALSQFLFTDVTDFCFHGSNSAIQTVVTACNSPIPSTVTPPITSTVCLSTTSVSWSTRTTPAVPSYNITASTPQPQYSKVRASQYRSCSRVKFLSFENARLKIEIRKLRRANSQMIDPKQHEKLSNSKTKQCQRAKAKKNCMKRELGTVNDKLAKCEKRHMKNITALKQQHQTKMDGLKASIKSLQCEIRSVESDMAGLEEQLKETKEELHSQAQATKNLGLDIQTKNGTTYSDAVRKTCYSCFRHQLHIRSVSEVIKIVGKYMFGCDLKPLPCASTVQNMVSEMKTCALKKAVEGMINSEFINLAFDATSIKDGHVNEIHVNTDSGSYIIGYDTLAGGEHKDYANHIEDSLKEAIGCYCSGKNLPFDDLYTSITKKITSTLTDRAAVNKKTITDLEKRFGHELLMLNCNVHPLDSLSAALRKHVKEFETEHGCTTKLYGKDSALMRLVLIINKLKYKQGKGDPTSMRSFFDSNNLDRNLIPRYVGNRFHTLFLLCASIYYLTDNLNHYLTSTCCKPFAKDIRNTLNDPTVQKCLLVGGLYGKCLTGPWMKKLYRNSEISNLESGKYLQLAVSRLKDLAENPIKLWDPEFNCFDVDVNENDDPIRTYLCNKPADDSTLGLVTILANAFTAVVERQAANYLDGGAYSELPPERIVLGTNAPADNMIAESLLGMADNMKRKCPNASDTYIMAKIGFAHNTDTE